MSGANVFVRGIGWAMKEYLGAEVSYIEAEDLSASHGFVAAM
jgi:hypothetical protein